MKIDIVVAALPPKFDAIGSYTANFAAALVRAGGEVRLLTARRSDGGTYTPIPGASIVEAYSRESSSGIRELATQVAADPPDWLLLQYNPFQFGRWGLNFDLPLTVRKIRRQNPKLRLATMFHETFVPPVDLRFMIMSLWQRPQFRLLCGLSDLLFFSVDPWVKQVAQMFPEKKLVHLPVGSNVQRLENDRDAIRQAMGIEPDTLTLGMFGGLHISRMMPLLLATFLEARKTLGDVRFVHIGPDGPQLRAEMEAGGIPGDAVMVTDGPVSEEEVSRRFAAMDVCLCPFIDGVSTRRSSFMTSIQHGVASLGTIGGNTDDMLRAVAEQGPLLVDVAKQALFIESALRLLRDAPFRAEIARHGEQLYVENFTFERTARRMIENMNAA